MGRKDGFEKSSGGRACHWGLIGCEGLCERMQSTRQLYFLILSLGDWLSH